MPVMFSELYSAEQLDFLKSKVEYIWWETPDEALEQPNRLIARIMDIGTTPDVGELESLFSKKQLADVLKTSEIGQFQPMSWSFWHYRLGLIKASDPVPKMPLRRCGANEFVPREITDGLRDGMKKR